eukprot:2635164-Rhodomonas_salina.4
MFRVPFLAQCGERREVEESKALRAVEAGGGREGARKGGRELKTWLSFFSPIDVYGWHGGDMSHVSAW